MDAIRNPPSGRTLEVDQILAAPGKWIFKVAKEKCIGETTSAEPADTTVAEDQGSGPGPSTLDPSSFQGSSSRIVKLLIVAVILVGIIVMFFLLLSQPTREGNTGFPTGSGLMPHDRASVATPWKPGKDGAGWDDSFIEQVTGQVVFALRRDPAAVPE